MIKFDFALNPILLYKAILKLKCQVIIYRKSVKNL